MYTFKPFMGAIVLLLMVSSCNHGENKSTEDKSATFKSQPEPLLNSSITTETAKEIPVINDQVFDSIQTTQKQPPQKVSTKSTQNIVVPDFSKKIIKNASVKLEVKDLKVYNDMLGDKIKQYGAYVAQEDNNITDELSETTMSIKVPVQFFDDLMNAVVASDAKVVERSIKSEDVTGDIVDTRSRLEAKKQMRLKYLDFLKESKNMTEVLQVQDEINNIQEEIEAASGRYASLTTQAAYSTIHLTFFKPVTGYSGPSDKPSFFGKVSEAFKGGAEWVSNLFIGLISVWPLLLVILAGLVIYKKRKPSKILQQNV